MSKPEESKLGKLKQFLGFKGNRASTQHGAGAVGGSRTAPAQEFIFTKERLKDISVQTPSQQRLRNIRDLFDIVSNKNLEENAVESVYHVVEDLLRPQAATEERQTVLKFLQCLIKGQYHHLGVMRAHFFRVIKNHTYFEDLSLRLDLLIALSTDGKDVEYFEEEWGVFLGDWMKDIISSSRIEDFLQLLVNTIKYNAAYLDEEVLTGIVMHTCSLATKSGKEDNVNLCLKVLDTVICYSCLPLASLEYFIVCLCQVLNVEKLSQEAWQLMRKLLGTHLGHCAIHTMCGILQENNSNLTGSGALLLRGAVYFISMALWGHRRVASLRYPPSAVLPSFLQSLNQNGAPVLANEIILSVQRLIDKYGGEQPNETWDLILDIVQTLFKLLEAFPAISPVIISNLHDLLTAIETLHERQEFHGSTQRFFSIIEHCANKRPESSIMMLVAHEVQDIIPSVKDNWILKLDYLLEKYFKQEVRTKIRLKVLESLHQIINRNKYLYADSIIELVVLPHFSMIEQDTDTEVKVNVIQFIVSLLQSNQTTWHQQLLDILHKVINKLCHQERPPLSPTLSGSEQRLHERPRSASMDTEDVLPAVDGLIMLFKDKMQRTNVTALEHVFRLLYEHLQAHYSQPHVLVQQHTGVVRLKIFELLLSLRTDSNYRLGLANLKKMGQTVYSSFVYCYEYDGFEEISEKRHPVSPERKTIRLSYSEAFKCIRLCLEKENNWKVLQLVLEQLPLVLKNKTLLLATRHSDIDGFCARLCLMVSDRHISDKWLHAPTKKSDFHSYIFPVLTCLVSYHTLLDKQKQHDLVRCLEFGLVSKCARICVRALTVCALEMQGIMMRQLPNVLLKLSQISATVAMAIPLMEFLSSLIQSPQLYSNFVEDQYMSVFAIALPYTNPFKYSHYTVSLAYNVVGLWFIKCRVPFRKGFVSFILKNLKSNENDLYRAAQNQNQDSSERFRTQSLNDEALRRRGKAAAANVRARLTQVSPLLLDEGMRTFHKELMETCVDMLARYAFSTRSNLPKRSPVAEFLLHEGQKQCWLLGSRIITVVTSSGAKVGRAGLCEECLLQARAASKLSSSSSSQTTPSQTLPSHDTATRRRHKSAAVPTQSQAKMMPLKQLSQDDMSVNQSNTYSLKDVHEQRNSDMSSESAEHASQSGVKSLRQKQALLETKSEKIQAMDSVLMGLRANPADKSIFSPHLCSCWCTQWAEISIRRPTGTLSWIMRIQNEEELTETFPDFPLSDISSLFIADKARDEEGVEDDTAVMRLDKRIDSSMLMENEYENLLEEHFYGKEEKLLRAKKLFVLGVLGDDTENSDVFAPDTTDSQKSLVVDDNGFVDGSNIKKTSSAPEFRPDQTSPSMSRKTDGDAPPEMHVDTLGANVSPQKPVSPITGRRQAEPSSPDSASRSAQSGDSPKRETSRGKIGSVSSSSFVSIPEELPPGTDQITPIKQNTPRSGVESPASSVGGTKSSLASSIFGKDGTIQGGINPSFVFLQLYYSGYFGETDQRPIRLPQNETVTRSLKMLDMIYPFQTHKIGVVYVGKGQTNNESAILSNQYGSTRYMQFLEGLGQIVRLKDCSPEMTYLGGLDTKGGDGLFAYTWQDEVMQVVFHAATLMPNKESDQNCNQKKLHIGNDYVTIVYNDSAEDFKIGTIKCQFNYVNIIIQPLDLESNAVTVQTRDDIEDIIGHTDTKIISDAHLSTLARQMAVHADLASIILQKQKSNPKDLFASNWLERLRQIKRIRSKVQQETVVSPSVQAGKPESPGNVINAPINTVDDFTDFVQ